MSLLEALEANKDYSKFLGIIKGANLTHLISNETRDVTLLVPTNDVFEEQKEYYEELSRSHGNLEPFIKMHMVLSEYLLFNASSHRVGKLNTSLQIAFAARRSRNTRLSTQCKVPMAYPWW